MMKNDRFKIDLMDSYHFPFGLCFLKQRVEWGWTGRKTVGVWHPIASFQTQAEAKAFYNKVKDLPEYLP